MSRDQDSPITKASDVAHVRFALPDLEWAEAFLRDFGLRCTRSGGALWGHGSAMVPPVYIAEQAGEPAFIGFGIYVDDDGLDRLAETEGAGIEPWDAGGSGRFIRLTDPDGFTVEAIAPSAPVANSGEAGPVAGWNEGEVRGRTNARLEIEPGPSRVRRLGHVVLNVRDFETSAQWYSLRFGLIRSDEIYMGDREAVMGSFFRCDRGAAPADHHSLFLLQGGAGKFEHAAFEVSGFNDLMRGHDHLKRAGAQHEWGVGRHILGSHIFDYWRDPWGFELEHWTDGDVLDASHPPGRHSMEVLLGTQWGEVHKLLRAMQASEA